MMGKWIRMTECSILSGISLTVVTFVKMISLDLFNWLSESHNKDF